MHESDVLIVGSGQAAKPLATRLARAGRRVVLFEAVALGGTCINTGCTPTKTMIASARAAHVARTAARLGVHVRAVEVDLAQVVDRKDAVVGARTRASRPRLAAAGERLRARAPARAIRRQADGRGGRRAVPRAGRSSSTWARDRPPRRSQGLDTVPWLDNASLMALRRVPEHLVVVGGGYVGCEMGQMFRRFGARVTIVHSGEHLLSREDADIAAALEGVFRAEGIDAGAALLGHRGRARRRRRRRCGSPTAARSAARTCSSRSVAARTPTRSAARPAACASMRAATSWPTSTTRRAPRACTPWATSLGGPQFTHTSWDDHRRLFDILMKPDVPRQAAERAPHSVLRVHRSRRWPRSGLNEKSARARGIAYQVATMPMADVARAFEVDEKAGLMKVLVDPSAERILGASIVGAEAGELIHVFISLMQAGASPRAIVDAEFIHPTFSEGLQTLVMKLPRYALS